MKKILIAAILLFNITAFAQEKDSPGTFKKRVLENTEVDFLLSYYNQDGTHSPVSGGIGSEKLTDVATSAPELHNSWPQRRSDLLQL